MRAIESSMLDAINQRRSWKLSNTEVYVGANDEVVVTLFGNRIATITNKVLIVSDAGWQSTTTKSRLNAILSNFNIEASVYQKNHEWYIGNESWTGKHKFNLPLSDAAVLGGNREHQPGQYDAVLGGK
jgi:hypothetical protein